MFDVTKLVWTPSELPSSVRPERIDMTTLPFTDLWQRTLSGTSADNAPVLQMTTEDLYFTFTVKAAYNGFGPYDQCGVVAHMTADTWFKASMEYENGIRHLGSVVTNNGYSDWAAVDVPVTMTEMWYRLSRSESDFLLEYSEDGEHFGVLRMFHMWNVGQKMQFGVYACSPQDSSFTATFTNLDYQVQPKGFLH